MISLFSGVTYCLDYFNIEVKISIILLDDQPIFSD